RQFSLQTLRLVPAVHEVHVLHGLTGCTFEQVVQTGNNHEPAAIAREAETEVTVIGVHGELDFRQTRRRINAYPALVLVEILEAALNLGRRHFAFQVHINRGQNPTWDGQKMRSENQLPGIERQLLEDLAGMTVSEYRVGGEVVGHRYEMSARSGRLTSAGHS